MISLRHIGTLVLFIALLLSVSRGQSPTALPPEPSREVNPAKPVTGSPYDRFDPERLKEKYSPAFKPLTDASATSGFSTTTEELFKTLELDGTIPQEEYANFLTSLVREMLELAKTPGGVAFPKTTHDLKALPSWISKLYLKDVDPVHVHCTSLDYSDGPIHGRIEILGQTTFEKEKPGWKMFVIVHETGK